MNSEFVEEEEFARGLKDREDFKSQRQGKCSPRWRKQQEVNRRERTA